MASTKPPFEPIRLPAGPVTSEQINRVQDAIAQALSRLAAGLNGVSKVTSRDGTVIINPRTGTGAVDLAVVQKVLDLHGTGALTLVPPANAPNDLLSTTAANYLEIQIGGDKYVVPLWKLKSTAPFHPPAGLELWLKGDDSTKLISSGGSVTAWNDASGNSFNLTNLSGSPSVGTVNGLSCLATSAGNKIARSAALFSAGAVRDIYVVAQPSGNAGYMHTCMGSAGQGMNLGFANVGGSSRYVLLQWFGPDAYYNDGGHDFSGETHIFRYTLPSSSVNSLLFEIDGVAKTLTWDGSYDPTADVTSPFSVGGFGTFTDSRDWAGNTCEIMAFNSVQGSSADAAIRAYLQPKWNTP